MKKEEYFRVTQEFRERMLSVNPEDYTDEDFENWLTWDTVTACHVEGCPANGLYTKTNVNESLDGIYRVVCGICCNTIWDIDPLLEDDEDFRLNVVDSEGNYGVWKAEE